MVTRKEHKQQTELSYCDIIKVVPIFLLLLCNQAFCQIDINLDKSNAELVFQVLSKQKDAQSSGVLELEGTKKLIKQANQFNPAATEQAFIDELNSAVLDSNADQSNVFQFRSISENLEGAQFMYDYVLGHESDLKSLLNEEFSKFLLSKDTLTLNIFLLMGGTSDGFAHADTFCLDLGYFGDDVEAMKLLLLHETFHIVQNRLQSDFDPSIEGMEKSDQYLYDMLTNLFWEGSASYIANPLIIKEPKAYTTWLQRKYRDNSDRMIENFELFNSLFYRLKHDDEVSFDDLYNIGFGGNWGSPLYFVGFRMCELISKYEGENFLSKYLRQNPTQFFLVYNKYAKVENTPDYYPVFNSGIENSIELIDKKMNRTTFNKK